MEVDAAGGLQHAMALHQAHGEEAEERRYAVVVGGAGGGYDVVEGGVIVFDLLEPDGMDLVPRPLVGEDAGVSPLPVIDVEAGGSAAVAARVEGRVGCDEVDGLANLVEPTGRELAYERPVIIVMSDGIPIKGVTVVVPLTAQLRRSQMPLAVEFPAGEAGLRENSVALCHNVHALDAAKLRRKVGDLGPFLSRSDRAQALRIAATPRPIPLILPPPLTELPDTFQHLQQRLAPGRSSLIERDVDLLIAHRDVAAERAL